MHSETLESLTHQLETNLKKANYKVEISEPRLSGGLAGLGATWNFSCRSFTKFEGFVVVKRSYKDFVALHHVLLQKYPGIVLAELPHDNKMDMVKSSSSKEVALNKRSDVLNIFIKTLAKHPFVCQDQDFVSFLRDSRKFSQIVSDLDNKKSDKSSSPKANTGEQPSVQSWKSAIRLAELPDNPSQIIKMALGELDVISKSLHSYKQQLKKLLERYTQLSASYVETEANLEKWLGAERACSFFIGKFEGSATVIYPDLQHEAGDSSIAGTLELDSRKTGNASKIQRNYVSDVESKVLPLIRYEMLLCQGMVTQLLNAKSKQDKYFEFVKQKAAVETELESIGTKLQGSTTSSSQMTKLNNRAKQLEVQINEMRQTLAVLSINSQDYIKAVISLELGRFLQERSKRVAKLSDMLTSMERYQADALLKSWNGDVVEIAENATTSIHQSKLKWGAKIRRKNGQKSFKVGKNRSTFGSGRPNENGREAVVIYDFQAENDDELDVTTGIKGYAIPYLPDENWVVFTVADPIGMEKKACGIIPATYIRWLDDTSPTANAQLKRTSSYTYGSFNEVDDVFVESPQKVSIPPEIEKELEVLREKLAQETESNVKIKQLLQQRDTEVEQLQLRNDSTKVNVQKLEHERMNLQEQFERQMREAVQNQQLQFDAQLEEEQQRNKKLELTLEDMKKQLKMLGTLKEQSDQEREQAEKKIQEEEEKRKLIEEELEVVKIAHVELAKDVERDREEDQQRQRTMEQELLDAKVKQEEIEKEKERAKCEQEKREGVEQELMKAQQALKEMELERLKSEKELLQQVVEANNRSPRNHDFQQPISNQFHSPQTPHFSTPTQQNQVPSPTLQNAAPTIDQSQTAATSKRNMIATQQPKPPPISQWTKAFDSNYNRYYYYNSTTRESTWFKPKDYVE